MKKRIGMITTLVVIMFAFVGLNPAFADTQPTTTVTNTSSSVSTDQAVVTTSAHIDTNVSSNTVFYVTATGMPKSQVQSAIYHHHVVTLTRGMTLWTSYINVYGHEVWHWKYYAAGHKFYLGPDGYYHDSPCNNKVIVPHSKPLPSNAHKLYGSIIVKVSRSYIATSTAKLTLTVKSTATASCGSGPNAATATGTGQAYIYTYVKVTVSGSTAASVNAAAVNTLNAKLASESQTQLQANFTDQQKVTVTEQASGSASASASASVTCSSTTPPAHWTQVSCTGFEEITVGGSFLVDCSVSDDNGAPIALTATSPDGNTRVSGINCYSNGGSQTCPSGGTFEFRVTGVNQGTSQIVVTASANGVDKTFTSDPFPVDPSAGGF